MKFDFGYFYTILAVIALLAMIVITVGWGFHYHWSLGLFNLAVWIFIFCQNLLKKRF